MLRFGCHKFLNAKPLTYALTKGIIRHRFKLIFDTPANLSEMLKSERLDLAVIPSIEYARISDLKLIRGFSISSLGTVNTVLLFSKREIHDIETIAVDNSSRTSVAMLKIVLKERFKIGPEFIPAMPVIGRMMEIADAGLIIGDNALKIDRKRFVTYDLGEEWYLLTGRPFVHALLAARDGVDLGDGINILKRAIEIGIGSINDISSTESKRLKISREVCIDYLTKRIRYVLGYDEIEGLKYFYKLSRDHGIIDSDVRLQFYDEAS
jgi:chorismate dehydratase